jgi:hypothetical protein
MNKYSWNDIETAFAFGCILGLFLGLLVPIIFIVN